MVIDMKEIIALDVGGSTVKCAHFTTEGILKDKWLVTSSKTGAGMQIFSDIAKSLKKRDIDLENIRKARAVIAGIEQGAAIRRQVWQQALPLVGGELADLSEKHVA